MSKQVDERVVSMEFDNKNFESNVQTSVSTLDKLKKALKFDGAAKGFNDIDGAAKKVNFSPLGNSIETINAKFSAMQVIGMTALSNITTAAMNAGSRLTKAITIDPIISGFHEYETQINAVQTILANTQSKGSNLQDVNRALDELNTYTDKTIYNFTEMTRNIGTFTAAGVDLDKSVTSIKGIANLAAVSGSTSQQASAAMYQLSQAIANGKVQLMDWNSVVNAGMGGEVFQNALKRTAENMGYNVDALIEKYGSFRESLTKGEWLTTDVLTETLTQLSGAYTEADLLTQGYTKSQAQEILQLAETAANAATKVKTFSQLFDTLGEALQSGWTQSWEIIIGDFNEAQDLLTKISDTISGVVNESTQARNDLLIGGLSSGWKQLLNEGINDEQGFIESIKTVANEHGIAVDKMVEDGTTFEQTLKNGWLTSDVLVESVGRYADGLSEMSDEQLKAAGYTRKQRDEMIKFAEELKNNSALAEEFATKLSQASGRENIIQGLWNVFEGLGSVLKTVRDAFREVFPPMTGQQLYDLTEKFKNFTESLKPSTETLDRIKSIASGIFSGFSLIGKGAMALLSPIGKLFGSNGIGSLVDLLLDGAVAVGDFLTALNQSADTGEFFSTISDSLGAGVQKISELISGATAGVRNFGDIFTFVGGTISNVASNIWDALTTVFGWIKDNIGLGDIFNGVMAVGVVMSGKGLLDIAKQVKKFFSGGILGMIFGTGGDEEPKESPLKKIGERVSGVLDQLHESLQAFTTGIKAKTLVEIAAAMWLLGDALEKISGIQTMDMAQGLFGIAAMFTMLNFAFKDIAKTTSKMDSGSITKSGVAILLMSYAMKNLAQALVSVSDLNMEQVATGLIALGGALGELVGALKILDKYVDKVDLKTIISLVIMALMMKKLAEGLKSFATMGWEEIARGLTAMGGALGELVAVLAILDRALKYKVNLKSIVAMVAMTFITKQLAEGLKSFGSMDWESIGRGLTAMGGALGELTTVIAVLGKFGGGGSILGSVGILITVQALDPLATALQRFGSMDWEEIGRGLAAMGGALLEVAGFSGALGSIAGFGAILGGGSILITVQALDPLATALQRFGSMDWESIGRGLAAMGGALLEVSGANLLAGIGGLASLAGSGSIYLTTQALGQLATALQSFGSMDWNSIGRGLTAMGGAMLETAIGGLLNTFSGLGSGSIYVVAQGLTDLAEALQKFGEMNWDEIGRGLTAMGAAMGETALGGLLNTFSGFGAGAIAEMAEPLGILADSIKKWTDITVPEGFGAMLGDIAGGVGAFNFVGWGADGIAAVAEPLGVLADSVKKWTGVTVPEGLGEQLKALAPGIEAFNFAGWGGDAIATVAEPLGTMADSVSKWSNITIPENMQADLESLATGVKAFDWSWGLSMSSFIEPLANMADSVTKWNGVTVPENIQGILESLARGVKAFDWSWGNSMESFIEPLGDLGSVLKNHYVGLTVSTTIGDAIKSLGEGVKSLSDKDPGDISGLCNALKEVGYAAQAINGSNLASAGSAMSSFAEAINNINVSTENFANLGNNIVNSLVGSLTNGVGRVQAAAQTLALAATLTFTLSITTSASQSSAAGLAMASGLSTGFQQGVSVLQTTISSALTSALSIITSMSGAYSAAGLVLITQLASGISKGNMFVTVAIRAALSSAASTINSYYTSFYSAGAYISSGLAAGMSSKLWQIRNVAAQMASAAAAAARAAAQIKSPSRVFMKIGDYMGQGLAIGMENEQRAVYKAGYAMGDSAYDGMKSTISRLRSVLDSDLDINPTIRPVLDLSDVKNGAYSINGMLNSTVPLNVLGRINSIDRNMNTRIQNGTFNDVVNAIDNLRTGISELSGPSYTVNGVTYDDGTNIANAVGDLTRAIRLERRV